MGILKQSKFAKQDDPNTNNIVAADIERFMIACSYKDSDNSSVGRVTSIGKTESVLT